MVMSKIVSFCPYISSSFGERPDTREKDIFKPMTKKLDFNNNNNKKM